MKNVLCTLILIAVCSIVAFLNSDALYAEEATWLNTQPTIKTLPVFTPPQPNCVNQLAYIANADITSNVCVYQGNEFRYGLYVPARAWYEPYRSFLVFSYKNDTQMYIVHELSIIPFNPLALLSGNNGNDIVFYQPGRGWRVIKDIKSKLTPVKDNLGRTSYYTTPLPEVLFYKSLTDGDNLYGFGSIYGISNNGKWLVAINISEREAVRVNLSDYSSTLFSRNIAIDTTDSSMLYGSNFNISDDGRYVAAMGGGVPFAIFDVSDGCGLDNKDHNVADFSLPINKPCQYKIMEQDLGQRYEFYKGGFNKSGAKLTVKQRWLDNDEWKEKWTRLSLPGAIGNDLEYLALGDSFASGEGETDDKYYFAGTNVKHEKCHISSRSYPFLLANELGIRNDTRSVACSGAKMEDISSEGYEYAGQGGRLPKTISNYKNTDLSKHQIDALQKYIPGRTHQLDFVQEYNPKVATISIGGNDAGLVEKLATCAGTDECHWANDEYRPKVANAIKSKFGELVKTYVRIKESSPGIKLYVIGYPKILDEDSNDCGILIGDRLTKKEREFGNQAVSYLNTVIAAAARSAGVRYIDNNEAFGNKKSCGSDKPRAMNEILFDNDNIDGKSIVDRIIAQESFHPNPLGFELIKQSIKSAVPDIKDYAYCSNEEACATNESAPEPSAYWTLSSQENLEILAETTCIEPVDGQKDEVQLNIPNFSTKANSPLNLTVRSNPQSLGQILTDDKGGYSGRLKLPDNLESGYHTLHLKGESYSGEPIDLYQIFIVNEDGTYTLPGVDTEEDEAELILEDAENYQEKNVKENVQTSKTRDLINAEHKKNDFAQVADKARPVSSSADRMNSDSSENKEIDATKEKEDRIFSNVSTYMIGIAVIAIFTACTLIWRRKLKY